MKNLLLALGMLLSISVSAQLSLYNFEAASGTFDTLTSGTRVTAVEDDDEESGAIPIGFDFVFDGDTFRHVNASSNGLLIFDTTVTYITPSNNLDFSASNLRPAIAPLWDDLDGRATGGSKASYETSGTSPNRVFTFEWLRYEWLYFSGNPVISIQAKLYENDGKIEFVYRQESGSPISASASIGLAGDTTGSGNFLSLDGTGTNPNVSSTTEYSSLNTRPATGQIYRFLPPAGLDAGVDEMVNVPCAGSSDVIVVLKNYGVDTLTSATIEWSLATNGGTPAAQTAANWTGSLLSGDTAHVNLGTLTFSSSSTYDFTFYSDDPNSSTDQRLSNDTLLVNGISTGLLGTYTIGGTSPDYTTFSDAVAALDSFGVCGNVTFDVRYAAYNEQIKIDRIAGAGPNAQVTFRTESGAASQAELYFIPSFTDPYVVRFDGASYVTFDSIFIDNTSSSYGHVVEFIGANSYITITECRLKTSAYSTSSNGAIIYDYSGAANMSEHLTIEDNWFDGGSYGIYLYGENSTSFQQHNEIKGNHFDGFYYMGIYCYYNANITIEDNLIEDGGSYTSPRGIYCYYTDTSSIERNEIQLAGTSSPYGIYMYYCDGSASKPWLVANNVIAIHSSFNTGSPYGIYTYEGTENRLYYNTVAIESGSSSGRALYMRHSTGDNAKFINNSFANYGGGYAVYAGAYTGVDTSDYNNLYSTGPNLGYWGGNRANLTIYRTLSGKENNSISVDPGHWSPTDLRTRSVDLNNAGMPRYEVSEDFYGTSRNGSTPDIGFEEYIPPASDVGVTTIVKDLSSCGVTNQTVTALVKNSGTAPQVGVRVVLEVSGAVTTTLVDTIQDTIQSGAIDTAFFTGLNTSVGGSFNFKSYTDLNGDTVAQNDTTELGGVSVRVLPAAPSVSSFNICFGRDTQIVALSSLDSVEWYYDAVGGNPFFVGDTLNMTSVAQTDTFYLEGYSQSLESVGAADSTIGFGANYTNMTDGLVFNVYNPITLDSVTVYPNGSGNVVIILENSSGSIISSKTVSVSSAGRKRIEVGFNIQPGNDYSLHANTTTTGGLFRNSGGASYPMTNAGGDVEITETINSLASSGYYYFFYDWAITVSGCHSDRVAMTMTVDTLPILDLGPDTGYCVGTNLSYILDASNAGASYLWHDNSTNATYNLNGLGSYSVKVTTPAGCYLVDTLVVDTFSRPTATFIALTDVCESNAPYVFTNGGGTPAGGSGFYLGPGIIADSLFSPGVAGDGTHTIQYVYASGPGCSDTTSTSIVVKPKPTASLSGVPDVCANASAFALNQGSGIPAGGTELYFGTGVSGGQFNPVVGVGTYDIGYVYTGPNGCVDTAVQSINVDSLPLVSLGSVGSVCESEPAYALTHGNPSGGVYSGAGITGDSIFTPAVAGAGTHSISYTFTDAKGCSGSAQGVLRVNANPEVELGPDTTICIGETYFLDVGFGFNSYSWSTGGTANSIAVITAGTYSITVSDSRGCLGVDTVDIAFEICTGVEELKAYGISIFPNPSIGVLNIESDDEGIRDLEIFDATGRLVYTEEGILPQNLRLDLSELSTGVYQLQFIKRDKAIRQKFILE
jgi:hypothetical protein